MLFSQKTVIKDQIMSNNTKWFKHRYVRSIKITKHQQTVICQKMKPFCTFSYSKAEVGRGKVPNVWLYGPGCYVILVWRGIALVTARCLLGGYLSAHWFTGWRLKWWLLAIDGLTDTENEENRLKPQLLCDSSILPSPPPTRDSQYIYISYHFIGLGNLMFLSLILTQMIKELMAAVQHTKKWY